MLKERRRSIETILLAALSAGIIVYLLLLCRNNTVWCDEAFSVKLARSTVQVLIQETAADVHPPLYYLYLKAMCKLFGYHTFILHLTSALPVIALVIWAVTGCRHNFGFQTSCIFMIMLAFMPCSDFCLVLIRMYSLSIMFVTFCFFAGYQLICGKGGIYWLLFTVCGLGAAYAHYFAFATVGVLYICVFAVLIYCDRHMWMKCLMCAAISLLGYVPWLYYFVKSVERVNEEYWIQGFPTVGECITFLFGEGIGGYLLCVVFLMAIGLIIAGTKYKIGIKENDLSKKMDNATIMIVIACIVTGVIILFGDAYSYFIKPIFITRYLYPLAGIVWIAFGISFSKINRSTWTFGALLVIIAIQTVPSSISNYVQERHMTEETTWNITYLQHNYREGDILTSDRDQLPWRIFDFYMPNTLETNFDEIAWEEVADVSNVYMLNIQELDEKVIAMLESKGRSAELIRRESYIGKYPGYLYKLTKR